MQQQTTNKSDDDVDEGYLECLNMLKEEEPSSPIATAAMTATSSTKKKTAAVQWQKKKRTAAAAAAEEEDDGLEDSSSSLLPIVEDANEGKAAGIGEVVMPRQAALAAAEKESIHPIHVVDDKGMLRVVQARQQLQVSGDGGLNDIPINVGTETVHFQAQVEEVDLESSSSDSNSSVMMNKNLSRIDTIGNSTASVQNQGPPCRRSTLARSANNYFLSGDAIRPLLSVDEDGYEYTYYLRPIFAALCIMMLEVMYEFSGSGTTLVLYLQGEYTSQSWSSEMTTIEAGKCVNLSQALVYTTPFLVAIIADSFIGNYLTLLVFSIGAHLPGLIIIALTAYPYLLSETFPTKVLKIAMYVFIPLGSGAIVSCVSVFGAQQFHPTRQISQIESYFIYFYIFSSCGTLIGGMILPVLLQSSAFVGYMLVFGCYLLAVIVFVLGNYHYQYVKMKPQGRNNMQVLSILCNAVCGRGIARQKVSNGGKYSDMVVQTVKKLGAVIPVTMLALPFNIIFSQTLITIPAQGIVMAKSGFVDALWVQNFNHLAVIVIGALLSEKLYPYLEKQEKALELSSKYVIGAVFGSLAMLWSIIIDVMIVNKYSQDGVAISILWQAPTYMFLGAGEVFTICSAYDAAFNVSPNNLKVLAFGINLFLIGALPKFISQLLVFSCTSFFPTKDGSKDISMLSSYATAHVWKFFLVLLGISLFGVFLNALPPTRRYLKRTINFAHQDNELRQECSCRMIAGRLSVKDIQEMYSCRMIALSVRDIPAV